MCVQYTSKIFKALFLKQQIDQIKFDLKGQIMTDTPKNINELIPFDGNCYSVTDKEDNPSIVYQKAQSISEHQVQEGYLILAKNDFGRIKKRVNIGYFNKKTNFLVGENNSLLFWDTELKKIVSGKVSEKLANHTRYFLIYDMNFIADAINEKLTITKKNSSDKQPRETIKIILNKQFGRDIGQFLNKSEPTTAVIPKEFKILEAIIQINNGHLSINKQILINSNPDFLLGILEGYIQNKYSFILKNNINIYNFTYILNLLGAQYSIRSVDNINQPGEGIKEKQIRFRLPGIFKQVCDLQDVFFRPYKYYFDEEKNLKLSKTNVKFDKNDTTLFGLVNRGIIELIPLKDLVFIPVKNQKMYDLTMRRADATNFSLPCAPALKNSDGDVLAAVAILTEDAADECIRKFSTEMKDNFLNLATGGVSNWGIKLDAQAALYTATK